MRQIELIANRLKSGGSITSKEAFEEFGVTRLSSHIFALRRRGMDIKTEMLNGRDRNGNEVHFARYSLE